MTRVGAAGQAVEYAEFLSNLAVDSLISEAVLPHKPGLVCPESRGAHKDMDIDLMVSSAESLRETFRDMAFCAYGIAPSEKLRKQLSEIGLEGEKRMLRVTSGVNTHKGAVWSLGLLISAAAMGRGSFSSEEIAQNAGSLSRFLSETEYSEAQTHGDIALQKYGLRGARGEAADNFPHILKTALPALRCAKQKNIGADGEKLQVLMELIASVDDTCIVHRGGTNMLIAAKRLARTVIAQGCAATEKGRYGIEKMNRMFISFNLSPGGSADLLSATLFLDELSKHKGETNGKVAF